LNTAINLINDLQSTRARKGRATLLARARWEALHTELRGSSKRILDGPERILMQTFPATKEKKMEAIREKEEKKV
jgi:hypothetical protein